MGKQTEYAWMHDCYDDGRGGFYPADKNEADILRDFDEETRKTYMELRHAGKTMSEAFNEVHCAQDA